MLYKIEASNGQGGLLSLPLEDVANGLYVTDIQGLDPVKATLVSSSFARLDGAQYQSSRRETRNIVLTIELEPDYAVSTVRDLRKQLYDYFMPKSFVSLRAYMTDGLTVDISGRVESCETTMFAQEPTMTISVMCFDPDFVDINTTTVSGNTTSTTTETALDYDGTVEAGIVFTLNVNRTLGAFAIYQRTPSDELRILDFAASLVSGDVLKISTVPGNKYATLTRSGVASSILYGISPQSSWVELVAGVNNLRVFATGAAVPYTIQYVKRYGGL